MTDEEFDELRCGLEFWDGVGVGAKFNYQKFHRAIFEAGRKAERDEIAQMFDAEHEKRQGVDTFAQCAAVAIRARK